jgi:hypothetical protein
MIAVDTNILIHAHRVDSPFHAPAHQAIVALAEDATPWAIPWPCIHEFIAIATHPRVWAPPTPLNHALEQVDAWLESPSLLLLAESRSYWDVARPLLAAARITGPATHDARIAALCLAHGVRELLTADRDFGRFPRLTTRNPLVED